MASTVFVDNQTVIMASWLNDVNTTVYNTVPTLSNNKLDKSANLSDLVSTSTARTNLGLGTFATQNTANVSSNVAIGKTVQNWSASVAALEVKGAALYGNDFTSVYATNAYANTSGVTKYITGGKALAYRQNSDGSHTFSTAVTGVADATITYKELVNISESGARPYYTNTQAISATGSFTFDPQTHGQVCKIALTNAITVTFAAPTNIVEGAPYTLILQAGDTSARTFSWNAAYKNTVPTSGVTTSGNSNVLNFIGGAGNTLVYNTGV